VHRAGHVYPVGAYVTGVIGGLFYFLLSRLHIVLKEVKGGAGHFYPRGACVTEVIFLLPPQSSSYFSQVSEGLCTSVQVLSSLRVPMSLESLMDSYLLLSHIHIVSK
jgi:hypothetical protein